MDSGAQSILSRTKFHPEEKQSREEKLERLDPMNVGESGSGYLQTISQSGKTNDNL